MEAANRYLFERAGQVVHDSERLCDGCGDVQALQNTAFLSFNSLEDVASAANNLRLHPCPHCTTADDFPSLYGGPR